MVEYVACTTKCHMLGSLFVYVCICTLHGSVVCREEEVSLILVEYFVFLRLDTEQYRIC